MENALKIAALIPVWWTRESMRSPTLCFSVQNYSYTVLYFLDANGSL